MQVEKKRKKASLHLVQTYDVNNPGVINSACASNTADGASGHDLQLDWECLDAALMQKENTLKQAIDLERDFLYISALEKRYLSNSWATSNGRVERPPPRYLLGMRNELFLDERGHVCTRECKHLNLKKGAPFMHQISGLVVPAATGDVYVCVATGTAHVCDASCALNTKSARGESIVCPVSGKTKAPYISTASLTYRGGGGQTDDYGGGKDEAADEDDLQADADADTVALQAELEVEFERMDSSFTPSASASSARGKRKRGAGGSANGKRREKAGKGAGAPMQFGAGMKTVRDYEAAMPDPTSPVKRVCEKYDEHMDDLRAMCNKYMQASNIRHICISALENCERQSDQQIAAYVAERKRQGKRVDWTDIVSIHASINLQKICSMMPMLHDSPVPKTEIDLTARRIMGYIRIMWRTPYARAKRLPLMDYAVAILYNMKEGYSVTVHVNEETGRVSRIPLVEPPGGFVGVRKEVVVFMPKYDIDPLPKQVVARLLAEEAAAEAAAAAAQNSRRQKTSRARTRRAGSKAKSKIASKPPSTMKNNSFINKCYTSVIELELKLEELENYKLKDLPPSHSRVVNRDYSD